MFGVFALAACCPTLRPRRHLPPCLPRHLRRASRLLLRGVASEARARGAPPAPPPGSSPREVASASAAPPPCPSARVAARVAAHLARAPVWKTRPVWSASQKVSANWPRLEAALSLLQRWRGVREGEPAEASGHSGRLSSTQLQHAAQAELQLSLAASLLPLDLAPAATCTFMGRAHAGLPALILSAPCVRAAGF